MLASCTAVSVSSRRRRLVPLTVLAVAAALTGALGLTTSTAHATVPQARLRSSCPSSGNSGGSITQARVLARAAAWVRRNEPYSQSRCAHAPSGWYRMDCSGFVSMAWGLSSSLTTRRFDPKTNHGDAHFRRISRARLAPGDALVVDNSRSAHIALFTGWSSNDAGRHRYANLSEESRPGVGAIAITGQDLAGSYWGKYTPIRYSHMVLPKTPPTSNGGSALRTGGSALRTGSAYRVFWTAPSGHVMQTRWTGSRWATSSLGGKLAGPPAATMDGRRYDVFAVSAAGNLWHKRYYRGRWSGWALTARGFSGGVSAVWTGSAFNVFGHAPDGQVRHAYWGGHGWHVANLGGQTTGTPASTYHGRKYDVYAVSAAGNLWRKTYAHGAWSGWHLATSGFAPGVTAVWNGTRDHVFGVRQSNGHLRNAYPASGRWRIGDMGGHLARPLGAIYEAGRYDVYAASGGGRVYHARHMPGSSGWSSWHRIAG
jgi:hypothetical protein